MREELRDCEVVATQGEVRRCINYIGQQLSDLAQDVSTLQARLQYIRKASPVAKCEESIKAPQPEVQTELGQELHVIFSRLAELDREVIFILETLEI